MRALSCYARPPDCHVFLLCQAALLACQDRLCSKLAWPSLLCQANIQMQLNHINQMVQQRRAYTSRFRRYKVSSVSAMHA